MANEDKIPNTLPGFSRVFILTSQFRAIVIHQSLNAGEMCLHGGNDFLHDEKDCLDERENRVRSAEHLLGVAENEPSTEEDLPPFAVDLLNRADDLHEAGLGPPRGGDGHFGFEGNVLWREEERHCRRENRLHSRANRLVGRLDSRCGGED